MITRFLTVGVAVVLTVADAAAQRRPITHEDVWLAKRLGAPVVSPDGRWAAVQVVAHADEIGARTAGGSSEDEHRRVEET